MALPMISEVRVRAVDAPIDPPLRNSLNVIARAPLVIVDVRTDCGAAGTAYVFPYTPAALGPTAALARSLGAGLVGRARWRRRRCGANCTMPGASSAPRAWCRSRSRRSTWRCGMRWRCARGVPLCALLGGEPRPVPIYASLRGWGAAMLAEEAGRAVATLGARSVKFKLGQARLEDDLDTVRAVRGAVGADVQILVDYNQALTLPEAERRGRALEALDVRWLEEPLPVQDDAGLAELARRLAIPVQGGENWWGPAGMHRALMAGAVDLCMPDAMKIGGVTGWMRAAAMAAAHRVPMSSHIFVEASVHLLNATPTRASAGAPGRRRAAAGGAAGGAGRHGAGAGPAPGWGIVWNEAALLKHAADV